MDSAPQYGPNESQLARSKRFSSTPRLCARETAVAFCTESVLRLLSLLVLFSVLPCTALSASLLQVNGYGSWGCGFYPGDTGYGSETDFSFSAQDAAGNPISANLSWGNEHASPQCTPGMQIFQDAFGPGGSGAIFGNWSYLGRDYGTTPAGAPFSACTEPGCYLAVSVDESGNMSITLGYEDASGLLFLNLGGVAKITSSSFGQEPILHLGDYYYSDGTFTAGSVPEPAAWSLVAFGVFLLFACTRKQSSPLSRFVKHLRINTPLLHPTGQHDYNKTKRD